jgi:arsenate reductase-like glutaredoxin family protein
MRDIKKSKKLLFTEIVEGITYNVDKLSKEELLDILNYIKQKTNFIINK